MKFAPFFLRKLKNITILLTSCNGLISPSQIECLRQVKERKIRIIGVDMTDLGAGSRLVDQFYIVPAGESEEYPKKIYEICEKEKVDVVIPGSDEEVLNLSKEKEVFKKINTTLAINDYNIINIAADKGSFHQFLKEHSLSCAKFSIPKNVKELEKQCKILGYPKKPVVIKPRKGRGNKGFRIIQPNLKKGDLIFKHKPGSPYTTLDDIKEAVTSSEMKKFPDIILMEFLPGEEYSVDVLCKNGEPLVIIPKIRLLAVPGLSVIGKVDLNQEVIELVTMICRAFKFEYNVNLQFRYGEDQQLYPYEANTRIAASIAACTAAGANLLYFGIKLALNESLPTITIKNGVTMMRYYKEYYELNESNKK